MHPEESSEYSFPWRAVLLAMGASGYLVFALLAAVEEGRLWTGLLSGGLFLFAYAVYGLRRAARDEARRWKQRLKREKYLVAEAVRAEMRGKVESARPASQAGVMSPPGRAMTAEPLDNSENSGGPRL